MASMELESSKPSPLGIYIKTQILTKPRPPPEHLSFVDQTAIISGSNVGIGLETCRQMLARGLSTLVMAVRTPAKGEAAAKQLRESHPDALIHVWELDMLSNGSIQAFAEQCLSLERIDMVILNASVMNPEFSLCATGHEQTFQVNYLSTALLAILLLPVMSKRKPPQSPGRLTIVSSNAGLTCEFPNRNCTPLIPSFDDRQYWGAFMDRYATTKFLQQVLVHKLSSLIRSETVVINSVDPGLVAGSSLHRSFSSGASMVFSTLKKLTARSLGEAAWTYLDAVAVKGQESHGGFIVNWEIHPHHKMMYTEEGRSMMGRLWGETMGELAAHGVYGAVESLTLTAQAIR